MLTVKSSDQSPEQASAIPEILIGKAEIQYGDQRPGVVSFSRVVWIHGQPAIISLRGAYLNLDKISDKIVACLPAVIADVRTSQRLPNLVDLLEYIEQLEGAPYQFELACMAVFEHAGDKHAFCVRSNKNQRFYVIAPDDGLTEIPQECITNQLQEQPKAPKRFTQPELSRLPNLNDKRIAIVNGGCLISMPKLNTVPLLAKVSYAPESNSICTAARVLNRDDALSIVNYNASLAAPKQKAAFATNSVAPQPVIRSSAKIASAPVATAANPDTRYSADAAHVRAAAAFFGKQLSFQGGNPGVQNPYYGMPSGQRSRQSASPFLMRRV